MRYLTFSVSDNPALRLGALRGERVVDVHHAADASGFVAPPSLLALVATPAEEEGRLRELILAAPEQDTFALADVRVHAPIPRPLKNVFCMGLNYLAHARESGAARGKEAKLPTRPVLFTKAPTTVSGPYDEVSVRRAVTQEVDYEVELGVIIGTGGRDISPGSGLQHVFGYTVINDLSARDLQMGHLQWFKGKSLDGFCPMGPFVVTADEFGDPQQKRLRTRVNGVTKQDASTADMIFPVDAIIHWLSQGLTLEPGDIIATGTPEGVGLGRTPPQYLKDGDVVETEVEGIGVLRNRIRFE
jgi:2-keto-4-pentenoate hydratase/2-oxohepta-3-ene-1,7-dioic acid hydratase in catechol pathway